GIGKASAIELALLGANVTLVARNEGSLKKTIAELDHSKGQKHNYVVADFTHPDDLKQKIEKHVAGSIVHILINNTGGPSGGPIINAKTQEFTQTFSNHLV